MLEVARIMDTTEIKIFRLTALEDLNNADLSKLPFYRYKREEDKIGRVRFKNFQSTEG